MIRATGLYKSYENATVLRGVDITVARGEFVSIMGKSGSGKSTLLNLLGGNLKPDAGEVYLDGERISHMKECELARLRRTKLGFVYQSLNLLPTLTAGENILLPLYLEGGKTVSYQQRMKELSSYMGIGDILSRYPAQLSGGECQRVAIARSLIYRPSVILLDEPTGSLDSRTTEAVMLLLGNIHREFGVTIVQVTHNSDAASYGDRTVVLADGEVVTS